MTPHVTAIMIGVEDPMRSKAFYGEGLGCPIDQDTRPPRSPRRPRLGLAGARMGQAVSTSSAAVATVDTLDVSCREPQAEDGPGVV